MVKFLIRNIMLDKALSVTSCLEWYQNILVILVRMRLSHDEKISSIVEEPDQS